MDEDYGTTDLHAERGSLESLENPYDMVKSGKAKFAYSKVPLLLGDKSYIWDFVMKCCERYESFDGVLFCYTSKFANPWSREKDKLVQ